MYQNGKYFLGYRTSKNDLKNNNKIQNRMKKIAKRTDDNCHLKTESILQSIHSVSSLESIDSEAEIIDNSTFEEIEFRNLCEKPFKQSPTNRTALMLLDPDDHLQISKAKSDSHLYFCLEDDIYAKVCDKCPLNKNDVCDSGLLMEMETDAFPKRNTSSRMSLYKKMKSMCYTTKTANIESIRRKFGYSQKVSQKLTNRQLSVKENIASTLENFKFLKIHRTSEPNINLSKRSKFCKD